MHLPYSATTVSFEATIAHLHCNNMRFGMQVVPLRWNVQLVRHICTPNDADTESNLSDNVNADILILHGNARHFKMDVWFSRHVWFLFASPGVDQYWDATPHHRLSNAICNARTVVQDTIKDYLSHCSWLA